MAIRSKYQPFSFQERITPLLMLKEEYDKIDEGLSALGEAANQYYQFLDPETKKEVDAYNATLENVAGSLASEGLKAVSRNTLNNLRRQYNTKVKPIQEAAQTIGTIQAQIREMQMKDPTLMVQSVPSVKDIMADPNARPSLVSGTKLMQDGATAAAQLEGVSYDQLRRYLQGDVNAIPGIQETIDRIARDNNISTEQAMGYISRGITTGLGERAARYEQKAQEKALDYEYDRKLSSYKQGLSNAATQRNLDAQFLASGWKVDPTKSNINERYVFDEAQAKRISEAKSRSTSGRTTTKANASAKEITENYDVVKEATFIDKKGNNIESVSTNNYNYKQTIDANGLKGLSDDQIKGLFRSMGIMFDEDDYRMGDAVGGLDKDKLINDYIGYLNKYTIYKQTKKKERHQNDDDYEVISFVPRGGTKKVTTTQREAEEVAKSVGVETPKIEEEYDENLLP